MNNMQFAILIICTQLYYAIQISEIQKNIDEIIYIFLKELFSQVKFERK